MPTSRQHYIGRFLLKRLLGTGSFGSVYLAEDPRSHAQVAIKHLRRASPTHLFRFKNEFRLMANIVHPHLVRYHELQELDRHWYLVMEYIDGRDLLSHVRGLPPPMTGDGDTLMLIAGDIDMSDAYVLSSKERTGDDGSDHRQPLDSPDGEAGKLERIRAALPQLADGLSHLHQAGIFHRDLSPRNILVDGTGRIVILDFGMALQADYDLADHARNLCIGTPAYMAPEQLTGHYAGAASDWYAVGVLLYEMLTGMVPLYGCPIRLLRLKSKKKPRDPRLLVPDLPDDLCELCMDLLAIAPQDRPVDAAERLRRCAEPPVIPHGDPNAIATIPPPTGNPAPFVGRGVPLRRLYESFGTWAAHGAGRVVMVHGGSGMGKSALIRRFLHGLGDRELVLHGHCFQREHAAFKTLDSLSESLCRHLQGLDDDEVERLLPDDIPYLARMLPPLLLVPAIERRTSITSLPELPPEDMFQHALSALRVLLRRLSLHRRLIAVIDDLQWADDDSLNLLTRLLAPPAAPSLLLILGLRSDGGITVPRLSSAFRKALVPQDLIEVEPLNHDESVTLLRQLLPACDPATQTFSDLERNAGGNPLLLRELAAAYRQAAQDRAPGIPILVGDLFTRRVASLPGPLRQLLECVAVAGRPLSLDILGHAAGRGLDVQKAVSQLCAAFLLSQTQTKGHPQVMVFHDLLREALLNNLAPEDRRRHHAILAQLLAREGDDEADAVSRHWLAAGEPWQALAPSLVAADRAMHMGDADRALSIYRRLLDAMPDPPLPDLQLRMADALAMTGHNDQAAQAYSRAAEDRTFPGRLHALQRAASHFLRCGHIDEGVRCAQEVLEAIGQRWHEHPGATWMTLQGHRLRLWWGGMRTPIIPHTAPTSAICQQLDTLRSVAQGLNGIDAVRSAELHTRHLLLALTTGDAPAICHGLAWEAILTANEGGPGSTERAQELMAWGRDIAASLPDDQALAWCHTAQAFMAMAKARWESAIASCIQAEGLFRRICADSTWERGSLYALCWLPSLMRLGRLAELRRLVEEVEQEHALVGDLYILVTLRTTVKPWLHLTDGDPRAARQQADAAIASWSQQGWTLQHLHALTAHIHAALYCGDGPEAQRLLADSWPRFRASMQMQLQAERVTMIYLHGQAVVMCAADQPTVHNLTAEILQDITRLDQEDTALAKAHAATLRAALLAVQGDNAAAALAYHRAARIHDALDMPLHTAACRRQQAVLAGDTAGLDTADHILRGFGIREPAHMAAALIAGPPPAPWRAPTMPSDAADHRPTDADVTDDTASATQPASSGN